MEIAIVFALYFAFGGWMIWLAIKDDVSKSKSDE